jgi:hypothetical protein
MLIPGETLEAVAIQRRFFALMHRRVVVGATSGRLIVIHRGLFGGFTPTDFRWQDLHDANVRVGIFSAVLTISAFHNSDLATNEGVPGRLLISGLRKDEAQAVYRQCQAWEQSWREKRRIRELEELRAKSGGIQVGSLGGTPVSASGVVGNSGGGTGSGGSDGSPAARLQRIMEMRESGLLNDSEFEQIKAKILSEL